jgi:hypothetical protein
MTETTQMLQQPKAGCFHNRPLVCFNCKSVVVFVVASIDVAGQQCRRQRGTDNHFDFHNVYFEIADVPFNETEMNVY